MGLDRAILPTMFESTDITGAITLDAAERTGLKAGTPVVGGGGDQAGCRQRKNDVFHHLKTVRTINKGAFFQLNR